PPPSSRMSPGPRASGPKEAALGSWRPVGEEIHLDPGGRDDPPGLVDPRFAGEFENSSIEAPEPGSVLEMAQVGQRVTAGVDQTGILERASVPGVTKSNRDAPVGVADAVPALHVPSFREDCYVGKVEAGGDPLRIPAQAGQD